MASKKELKALITLAGKVDPSLQKALKQAAEMGKKTQESVEKGTRAARRAYDSLGETIKRVAKYAVAGFIAKGISNITQKGIELASNLNEVQNVVDTTFGQSSAAINAWSKTALKQFGLNELSAKKYASTLGTIMKSAGVASDDMLVMSQNLAGLSGDFASFYNLGSEEAFEKIRAGISGETEPLKQLGINMSVANLEAYALSKGIKVSYAKMDEASKTILRYNYLLNASKDAQGDFSKTSGSFANQQRLLRENFNQTVASLAEKFLPTLTKLMSKANEFLSSDAVAKGMASAEKAIKGAIGIIEKAYKIGKSVVAFIIKNWKVFEPLVIGIGAFTAAIIAWNVVSGIATATTTAFAFAVGLLASPITIIALIIAGIVTAGYLLIKNWKAVSGFFVNLWEGSILPVFQKVGDFISGIWNGITEGFKAFVNFFIQGLNILIRGMNTLQFDVPSWVPVIGGQKWGFNIPEIPMLATGGRILESGTAIVGERGPELVKLPRGAEVYSNDVYRKGKESSGGATYIFNYSPVINGGDSKEIREVLRKDKSEFDERIRSFFRDRERVAFSA